jgi:hypothetical protein
MADIGDLMDWLEAKTDEEERALATRRLIAQEQRRLVKSQPVMLTNSGEKPRKRPVVLTTDEWRVLLKTRSRASILRETGCNIRTITNRAEALGLPVPN